MESTTTSSADVQARTPRDAPITSGGLLLAEGEVHERHAYPEHREGDERRAPPVMSHEERPDEREQDVPRHASDHVHAHGGRLAVRREPRSDERQTRRED